MTKLEGLVSEGSIPGTRQQEELLPKRYGERALVHVQWVSGRPRVLLI